MHNELIYEITIEKKKLLNDSRIITMIHYTNSIRYRLFNQQIDTIQC